MSNETIEKENPNSSLWDSVRDVKFSGDIPTLPDNPNNFREVRETLEEDAKTAAKDMRNTTINFAERLARAEDSDELKIPEADYIKWEDDYRLRWQDIQVDIHKIDAHSDKSLEARLENPMIPQKYKGKDNPNVYKTIEAQAGQYFDSRYSALIHAINSGPQENAESARKTTREFNRSVEEHLEWKYMSPEEKEKIPNLTYESERTKAHNAVIKSMNKMNALAEQYNVRRFTVRDFWPSDLVDQRLQTPEIAERMRYDRDIVEAYYDFAYSGEIERRNKKLEREMKSGR